MQEDYNGVRSGSLECNHASPKIPPIFDNIEIWFKQIDAIFRISNISTEQTKFLHLTANLPPQILTEFQEFFDSNSTTPFSDVRHAIIASRKVPVSVHFDEIFNNNNLGDRRPSEYLRILQRHYRCLGATSNDDNILRTAFFRAMPTDVQRLLNIQKALSLTELAYLADDLLNIKVPVAINSSETTSNSGSYATEIALLTAEINNLKKQINLGQQVSSLCFYHRRYGQAARKCQKPCTWSPLNPSGKD